MNERQRKKLIQEEHDARKKTWGGERGNQYTVASGESFHLATENPKANKIRSEIAEEHKIKEGTVKVAVEVGRGIDRAAEVDPKFKNEVLSGEVQASKKALANIRKMKDDEEVKSAIEEIRNPKPKAAKNPNIPSKPRSTKIFQVGKITT